MPTILLKLVPFRDWLYAALAVVVLIAWQIHDHHMIEKGEAKEVVAVQRASAEATAVAQKTIDSLTAQYATSVLGIEASYEKRIQDNTTAHAADFQRLRERTASSSDANKVLGSSGSSASTPDSGSERFDSLGKVALGLADALRADDAALAACYADRDSLTGK